MFLQEELVHYSVFVHSKYLISLAPPSFTMSTNPGSDSAKMRADLFAKSCLQFPSYLVFRSWIGHPVKKRRGAVTSSRVLYPRYDPGCDTIPARLSDIDKNVRLVHLYCRLSCIAWPPKVYCIKFVDNVKLQGIFMTKEIVYLPGRTKCSKRTRTKT